MSKHSTTRRMGRGAGLAVIATVAVVPIALVGANQGGAAPPTSEPEEETLPTLLPLAPESERVDLGTPVFSDPTTVDNPLFPISNLHSAVLLGNNEGHPIRIETTLMPYTVTLEVDGQPVEALESQFVAYQDGRIHEVATDWYAQDDDRRGVVPRRGRVQLRGRRRRRHPRHVAGRARRRAGGDDHAGRTAGRRGLPPGEHHRGADGRGHDR